MSYYEEISFKKEVLPITYSLKQSAVMHLDYLIDNRDRVLLINVEAQSDDNRSVATVGFGYFDSHLANKTIIVSGICDSQPISFNLTLPEATLNSPSPLWQTNLELELNQID